VKHRPRTTVCIALASCLTAIPACEEKKPAPAPSPTGTSTPKPDDHGHAQHGGAVIELGAATMGAFGVKATRDEGQIVAGKDAAIDATITAAAGAPAKVAAVRFWIGTQDGKGSVKARAEIEDPKDPDRWHTHAEVPNPLPEGSKLWVEIETDKGETVSGSFDLKR
jgi:hypothetical protein